ncbi:MAG TPA: hypothetical protein VG938_10495 [Verrucomicrobiae bacterium]|jgi:hypothetical protein|nr:hypothetical protein [Verrucomicrobiae bacterium]
MLDLRHIAVRYRLSKIDTESLVRVADTLLAEGRDTPAVVQLSILEPPIMADAAPLFERACTELGVQIPNKDDAVDELLRAYLESIASGTRPAREGLEAVMREVYYPYFSDTPCKKYAGDSHGFEHLIGLYWGYDDLMEHQRQVSCDGKYGAEAITRWEELVRLQAGDWLQSMTKRPNTALTRLPLAVPLSRSTSEFERGSILRH